MAVLRLIDQLELGRLLDRQVGGLLALENAAGVDANLAIRLCNAGSVAHQTAGRGVFAPIEDRRYRVARRQCDQLIAPAVEERIGGDKERASALLRKDREGRVDATFAAGLHDMNFFPDGARRCLQVFQLDLSIRIIWVHKHSDHRDIGNRLAQHLQALGLQRDRKLGEASNVAAWPAETGDNA